MSRVGPGLAGVCLVALLSSTDAPRPAHPTDVGIWYWHTPFQVSKSEEAQLQGMGVKTIYVRAGTFTTDGKRVLLRFRQRYESSTSVRTILTLNFDGGAVRHLEHLPMPSIVADVRSAIEGALKDAKAAGLSPAGVQLDLDSPTRLLPLYTKLLKGVRPHVKGEFSITSLPTWITSRDFPALCAQVDFVAPQFYENRTGRTIAQLQPVGDVEEMKRSLRRLERLRIPYRIGVPSYGHALLYDPKGSLRSMYQGLSLHDALRHPALMLERTKAVGGERVVTFRAVRPGENGKGKDHRLVYTVPTPDLVAEYRAAIESSGLRHNRGTILYRFPEDGETLTLSLNSIASGMNGETPKVRLEPTLISKGQPWSAIAGADRGPGRLLNVAIRNVGTTATLPGAGAKMLVFLDRPGIEGVRQGEFDSVAIGHWDEASQTLIHSSLARADAVLFTGVHLLPGQRLAEASISVSPRGASRAQMQWTAKDCARGGTFEGETTTVLLETAK